MGVGGDVLFLEFFIYLPQMLILGMFILGSDRIFVSEIKNSNLKANDVFRVK